MRDGWLYAVTVLSSLLIGRGSVPVFPDYWPGGSAVVPVGEGPGWVSHETYRRLRADIFDEAAERAESGGFETDRQFAEFVKLASEEARRKAFAEILGPIEQSRMYDGDHWQADEAAKLYREFAQQARSGDGIN